jgi:hypothetical protein
VTDPSPEQLQRNRQLLLRGFVLLSALVGTVFYLGIWLWWWQIPSSRRDGFELIGIVLGTIYFVLFVVPACYFGLKNYALWIGAICGAIALGIATDTVFPWFPWQIFGGP